MYSTIYEYCYYAYTHAQFGFCGFRMLYVLFMAADNTRDSTCMELRSNATCTSSVQLWY